MGYMEDYKLWCEDPYFDEATRQELAAIADDDKEIEDRFYQELEFGTAGLRGVIGVLHRDLKGVNTLTQELFIGV